MMAVWAYDNATPLLSDACFDRISARLVAEWDSVEHWHKSIIDLETLACTGSALALLGPVPLRVQGAAKALLAGA